MKKKEENKTTRMLWSIIVLAILGYAVIVYCNNRWGNKQNYQNVVVNQNEIAKNSVENKIQENNIEEQKNEDTKTETKTVEKTELEKRLENGNYLSEKGLPVLMYHFFYDKNNGKGKDGNWIEISKFEEQMKYLSENNFYFPTWEEVENYIDGETELPEKSVVITVDDGDPSFFELGVPIIQKYNVQATSFVVTYWYGDVVENKQQNINYQSHSYDMHKAGANGKGVMLSWDYDKIKEDVLLSQQVLGGATIFCYPFGQYNDLDIKVLKDSGYKLALTTNDGRVKKGASKYELPRVRVDASTGIESFKKKVE